MKQHIQDLGRNNQLDIHESVKNIGGMKFIIKGNNNHIQIGEGTVLNTGVIECFRNDSVISVGKNCRLNGNYRIRAFGAKILIGDGCTFNGVRMTLHEAGTIQIGKDCMFSGDIAMDVSDMHGIFDVESGKRINPAENIVLEEHVWVCQGAILMKGITIGKNSVIGAKSLVASSIPANVIVGGVPAKVLREGVIWDRSFNPPEELLVS